MAAVYPLALSSVSTNLPLPLVSTATDAVGNLAHHAQHDNQNFEIIAVETYLGTNASQTTPTGANRVLASTSASASIWTATPTLSQLTLSSTLLPVLSVTGVGTQIGGGNVNGIIASFSDSVRTSISVRGGQDGIALPADATLNVAGGAGLTYSIHANHTIRTDTDLVIGGVLTAPGGGTLKGIYVTDHTLVFDATADNNDAITIKGTGSNGALLNFVGDSNGGLPVKTIQVSSSSFRILSNAFGIIFSLSDAGALTIPSSLTVQGGTILNTGSIGSTAYGLGTSNMIVGSYAGSTGTTSVDTVVGDVNAATVNGNVTRVTGLLGRAVSVVNGGQILTRQASIYGIGSSSTVTGTLTNNNTLYLETPTSGTTVRVIDTAAGGFLTTGGIWTNNPSWERLKEGIRPATEVDQWLEYLATQYEPVWYRHRTQYEAQGLESYVDTGETFADGSPIRRKIVAPPAVTVMDQDYEHDHFGFVLDPIHEKMPSLFEAMTNDSSGALSTKDTEGVLLAMVAKLAKRVKELEHGNRR